MNVYEMVLYQKVQRTTEIEITVKTNTWDLVQNRLYYTISMFLNDILLFT